MDKNLIASMDSYMLLSLINMKLRDEFENYDELCSKYDVDEKVIAEKLGIIGYKYNKKINQFAGV